MMYRLEGEKRKKMHIAPNSYHKIYKYYCHLNKLRHAALQYTIMYFDILPKLIHMQFLNVGKQMYC